MPLRKALFLLAIASASSAAWGNYTGQLRVPQSMLGPDNNFYAFTTPALLGLSPTLNADPGQRLKLGYKPSRYFEISSEYVDFGRNSTNPFANPAVLSSNFRSTGFGIDAVGTLPVWGRMSLYGRFGAYRGDARSSFAPYSTSLLQTDSTRGTRMRYGLGAQYEFNKAFGIRAELERYSGVGHMLTADPETDTFSVGVMWRF